MPQLVMAFQYDMTQRRFFFHHQLGYRSNPFGALTAVEWTAVAFIPPVVQQKLDNGLVHLQLLGPAGCGKTTTLLKLTEYFGGQGRRVVYEYLPEGQSHFETNLDGVDLFVLDEAQRLNRRERKRWLAEGTTVPRTAVSFIFSSHEDLTRLFGGRRPSAGRSPSGNLPLQSVHVGDAVTLAHYQSWIERRLAYFALPDVPRVTLSTAVIAHLYQTYGQEMREAEYFLYEIFQRDWPPHEIELEEIV